MRGSLRKVESEPRSLYVSRKLLNSEELIGWAKSQGFETTLQPGDLHVTVMYSEVPVAWPVPRSGGLLVGPSEERSVGPLGDGGAVVLKFKSPDLSGRWQELQDYGAVSSWPSYVPHVTITWNAPEGLDLNKVEPYKGNLIFGPEIFKEVDPDWKGTVTEKNFVVKFSGVNEEKQVAFGWAIVSKVDGEDYYDLQNDHIPEDAMLEASIDFMENSRVAGDMHTKEQDGVKKAGSVLFAFPLTTEAAKALDITSKNTGLMIGMKVTDREVWKKIKDGTYTGFSIGGLRITDEEVE